MGIKDQIGIPRGRDSGTTMERTKEDGDGKNKQRRQVRNPISAYV